MFSDFLSHSDMLYRRFFCLYLNCKRFLFSTIYNTVENYHKLNWTYIIRIIVPIAESYPIRWWCWCCRRHHRGRMIDRYSSCSFRFTVTICIGCVGRCRWMAFIYHDTITIFCTFKFICVTHCLFILNFAKSYRPLNQILCVFLLFSFSLQYHEHDITKNISFNKQTRNTTR